MTRKQVWRYYCEFCKKSGCSASHIKTHERHCTCNPDRECRMCEEVRSAPRDYHTLIAQFKNNTDLDWLRREVDGCPSCMLTVIRQAADPKDPDTQFWGEFNYKEEQADWWTEQLAAQKEQDELYLTKGLT